MTPIITVALPVFLVAAAGFLAGRTRIFNADDVGVLNKFVFNAAMPAALFSFTASNDSLTGRDFVFASVYGGAALATMALGYAVGRAVLKLKAQEAGAHALSSTLGNAVFLGLPIALATPGWAGPFAVLMLMEGVLVLGGGMVLMSAETGGGPGRILKSVARALSKPLLLSVITGFAYAMISDATGLVAPAPLFSFLDLLGRAAGATALFSLGLFFCFQKHLPIAQAAKPAGLAALVKLGFLPAALFAGMSLTNLDQPELMGPAALFTLLPTGVGAYVIASQFGCYVKETAAAVAVTTALSLATVSFALAYFAT